MPSLSRRRALAGGLCLCCLPAALRAAGATAGTGPVATEEVAPGLHIRRGIDQDASAGNDDAIANIGFIIGRDAVLVADPGGSLADGERLRASIREKTDLPIRYVAMSHVHPDHIFGAGAFRQDDPVFIGHARLVPALAQRGAFYQKGLETILGPGKAGPVVMPTMTVADHAEVDLGGRVIALTAHGPAHTDNDLSLIDQQSGTLLPADLLFVRRMPSLDGSLTGWLKELAALKALPTPRVVPGHGPAVMDWPAASADLERYLNILLRETREAVSSGVDISVAAGSIAASERGKGVLYDDYNGRNVTEAYKEVEWE